MSETNIYAALLQFVDCAALAERGNHRQLLVYCQWNDANGDFDGLTVEELREIVRSWAE